MSCVDRMRVSNIANVELSKFIIGVCKYIFSSKSSLVQFIKLLVMGDDGTDELVLTGNPVVQFLRAAN